MNYFAYDRMGCSVHMPKDSEMKMLISSVVGSDVEHPDVSLNTEDGWSLSYNNLKLIIFENVETGEGPWHIRSVSESKVLEFWLLLSAGNSSSLNLKNGKKATEISPNKSFKRTARRAAA